MEETPPSDGVLMTHFCKRGRCLREAETLRFEGRLPVFSFFTSAICRIESNFVSLPSERALDGIGASPVGVKPL